MVRREFLAVAAATGLGALPPVAWAETRVSGTAGVDDIVKLLVETPRGKLLEEVAARIKDGLKYKEVVAALLLAGVRHIRPRPSVGFKFHAVLVVHSAHLAAEASPESDRWLPIFWALDEFKASQAQDAKEGDWTMGPVREDRVPGQGEGDRTFREAMDQWDEEAADAAAARLARSGRPEGVLELFCRYGCRDFRSIGHKAIYVANGWRTLQLIGQEHAEPVIRSLAYALLAYEGSNPLKGDAAADRPWKRNLELAPAIRAGWEEGMPDRGATIDLLDCLRAGSDGDGAKKVVELLNRKVALSSIWDALFLAASELMMRQPGIPALHAVTTTNALRWTFDACRTEETRRLILLQNASFLPLFRGVMEARKEGLKGTRIDRLEPQEAGSAAEVLGEIGKDRMGAARKLLGARKAGIGAEEIMRAARLLIFSKGRDSHDYKFSSAVLEDQARVSPEWRDACLSAGMFHWRGPESADNPLVERTRNALK